MLYSEIIAVCSEIHTKHINTLCGQNVECRTYRAVNTLRLSYKNEPVNDVQWSNRCYSKPYSFLGAFARLRKAGISFVTFVCPHGTTRLPLDGFSWNFTFQYFSKIRQVQFSLTTDNYNRHFTWRPTDIMTVSRSVLLRIYQTKSVEKIKTHILRSVTPFQKSYCLSDNVE